MKKLINYFFITILLLFSFSFVYWDNQSIENAQSEYERLRNEANELEQDAYIDNAFDEAFWGDENFIDAAESQFAAEDAREAANEARKNLCSLTWNCLDQPTFEINVSWGDGLTPWKLWMEWESLEERANWILGTIMQRLMIALWVLSVLIMTIWAWYIILNNWQDELLSKWKSIFMAWIYAMLIALTSYYLIAIVRYMLYA